MVWSQITEDHQVLKDHEFGSFSNAEPWKVVEQ